jgi:Ran GTPase-activating protein (RanGAP) involved in mRNA processing and transport
MQKYQFSKRLTLNEMGLSSKSAPVIGQLLKVGNAFADWTHVDLSMNKLGSNLEPVIKGLKGNTKLV